MPGLLGKKLGMSSFFSVDGKQVPVTVLEVGPCRVVGIRTNEKDGYDALELGYGKKKEKHLKKPLAGFFKKNKVEPVSVIREFKDFDGSDYKIGDDVTTSIFNEGEKVKVAGVSKGKGFQGVMKRHGFGGVGGTTHGQGDRLRAPGSIGQSSYPSRVFKGQRMAGRTGNDRVTLKNVQIVKILEDKNIVLVKGPVPGSVNSIIEIKK